MRDQAKRRVAIDVLLVFASAFALSGLIGVMQADRTASKAYAQADRAELLLKLNSGMMNLARQFPQDKKSAETMRQQKAQFYTEARKIISRAIEMAPESAVLRAKKVILLAETEHTVRDVKKELETLAALDTEKSKDFVQLLQSIYVEQKLPRNRFQELEKIVENVVPPGWYQEVTRIQLLKSVADKKGYERQIAEFQEHYLWYVVRIAGFMFLAIFCAFVGSIVVLIQLFLLARKPASEEERRLIAAPDGWGWRSVYGVFIAWLCAQFLFGPLVKGLSGGMSTIASTQGIAAVALMTAAFYLFQNLPAIFFVWYLGLRHCRVGILEGIKLRSKVGRIGIFRLIGAGILTWFAAIPIVIACTAFAANLGSQGSSNPVLLLVFSAAKDANPLGIILFIFTLGVLPALCEETLFRGFLYTSLRKKLGAFLSMTISALIFSLAHLDLGAALQLFALGFLFAYVFEKTKSLIPAMIAHCMWNSVTFLMAITFFG